MNDENYKRATIQMLKRLKKDKFWKKLYTYVKVLLEQQES